MVTISLKGLWIVTAGLTVLYNIPLEYPFDVEWLADYTWLFFVGLILLWIATVVLTIIFVVGKSIAKKIRSS